MPNIIQDLIVDRVDLVDEGANSAAFIELLKRKEQSKTMELQEVISKLKPEHAQIVQGAIDSAADELSKAKAECEKACEERDAAKAECEKACEERDAAKAECEKACEERDAAKAECENKDDETEKASTTFDEEETLKSMPDSIKAYVTTLRSQKEAAEEQVRKAREAEEHAEAIAKAASLKAIPVEQEKLVNILKGASQDVIDLLTTVNAAIEGTVLDEVGKSATGGSGNMDAWSKIEAKAEEVAKRDSITKQKAVSVVIKENPELYKEYLKGGAN